MVTLWNWHICVSFAGIFESNKGGVVEARSYPHQNVSLKEDTQTSLEVGAVHITDGCTDGSNQPTDVTSDSFSTGNKD